MSDEVVASYVPPRYLFIRTRVPSPCITDVRALAATHRPQSERLVDVSICVGCAREIAPWFKIR